MRTLLFGAALLAWIAPGSGALANATHARNATVTVRGSVPASCSLATTPASGFVFTIGLGYIHGPGHAVLQQGSLTVKCTNGAHTQIGMNTGLNGAKAGAQYGSRSMSDGSGDYLGYELCHDGGCSSIWSASGYTYVSTSDAGASLPVWTRILSGQPHVKQGQYSDSVTVTISF